MDLKPYVTCIAMLKIIYVLNSLLRPLAKLYWNQGDLSEILLCYSWSAPSIARTKYRLSLKALLQPEFQNARTLCFLLPVCRRMLWDGFLFYLCFYSCLYHASFKCCYINNLDVLIHILLNQFLMQFHHITSASVAFYV